MLHQRVPVRVDLDAAHVEEAALGVAADRVLDLDDVGAPVGEDRARRRDERELRQLQDSKARHYLDHFRDPTVASNVTGSAVGERKG